MYSAVDLHRYLTVVLDLDSGAVFFVGDGEGGDALKPGSSAESVAA